MSKTAKSLLQSAQRLVRDIEGDVNTAQAYSQQNGNFVWMRMNEAKSRLQQLRSTLEALSKEL